MTFVTVVLALIVVVLRLRAQVYDLQWTQTKVVPLMLRAAQEDPENREYLDPDSLKAWTRGEIRLDEVAVLPVRRSTVG